MYRNVFLGAILLSMPLVVWSQQDTIADQRLEEIMVTAKLPLVEISAGKTKLPDGCVSHSKYGKSL